MATTISSVLARELTFGFREKETQRAFPLSHHNSADGRHGMNVTLCSVSVREGVCVGRQCTKPMPEPGIQDHRVPSLPNLSVPPPRNHSCTSNGGGNALWRGTIRIWGPNPSRCVPAVLQFLPRPSPWERVILHAGGRILSTQAFGPPTALRLSLRPQTRFCFAACQVWPLNDCTL